MRPRLVLTLAALLASAALAAPPPEQSGHDLRGPALKKGLVLTVKTTSEVKGATVERTAEDGTVTRHTIDTSKSAELRFELLACEGRAVTRQRVTLLKRRASVTLDGRKDDGSPSPLEGKTLLFERVKGAWQREVEKGAGDEAPGAGAEGLTPWTAEDGLYPAGRVKVGETWTVGAKALRETYAESGLTEARGEMKGKLRAVRKYRGELCAVIDFEVRVRCEQKAGGAEGTYESTSRNTVYRSLASGITLKMTVEADNATTFPGPPRVKVTNKKKAEMVTTVKVSAAKP